MDAMSLLCVLHADGPATLRRLRRLGCNSLEEVQALPVETLANLMGASPAGARRLQREARLLGERMVEETPDREETPPVSVPATELDTIASSMPNVPNVPGEPALVSQDKNLVDEVLRTWRDRDRAEHTPESQQSEGRSLWSLVGEPEPEPEPGSESGSESGSEREREQPVASLVPGTLDGLGAETCERLAAAGITSLEQLAALDPLESSQTSGVGYTQLLRLQFLARRVETEDQPQERTFLVPQAENHERFSPAEAPAADPGRQVVDFGTPPAPREAARSEESPASGPFA